MNFNRFASLTFALLLIFRVADAAPLIEDHFDYPNGNLGAAGVGNTVWTDGDSPASAIAVNSAAALDYPGLGGATGSGVIFTGGTFKKKSAPFASQNAGSVYCSFLLNVQTAPTSAKLIAWLNNAGGGTSSPGLGIFLDGTQVGLAKRGSSPAVVSSSLTAGTHLVVARYSFLAGNDQVDLWINPASLGDDADIPVATLTTGTASSSDMTTLTHFVLNHGISQTVWIDEVRVGTAWSDVTPTGTAPTGSKLGFSVQPANGTVSATLSPVVVQIQSLGGGAVASNGVPVTLTLTSGSGTLGGTISRDTDATGKATFDDLTIDAAGSGKQLTASASEIGTGLTDAVSATFAITQPGVATKLTFTTQPSTTQAGQVISPAIVVEIQDTEGTSVASNGVPVTLTLTGGSGGLSGTTTRSTDSDGRAMFDDLSIDSAGAGKQLTAAASGVGEGLTDAASDSFTITAAPQPPANGAPVITQTLLTPEGIVLRGTNGTPTGNYEVVTTTNPALAMHQWSAIATNKFNAGGNFDCTNPVPSLLSQSYFRILSAGGNPPGTPDFSHVGFASAGITLTGGEGGPVVVVSNTAQLQQYTDSVGPYVIYVLGTIPVSGMSTHVRSHKTIIGIGTNATLDGGGLYMHGGSSGLNASNIIIRNLTIRNSTDDNIGITTGAKNIWVDHCTFYDSADGTMDIVKGADNVTVSWCKFYYTNPNNGHRFINLVGASDSEGNLDTGKLNVTFHHNWWGALCDQRMPSVRFGRAHVFNNYYNATNNLYCVRSRLYAEVRVENNYFSGVRNPWEVYVTSAGGTMGKVLATNNILVGTFFQGGGDDDGNTVVIVPGTDNVFVPPYAYTPDDAADVPATVMEHAGAGRGPFAP